MQSKLEFRIKSDCNNEKKKKEKGIFVLTEHNKDLFSLSKEQVRTKDQNYPATCVKKGEIE